MRLAVFSHKHCWDSTASPSGFATDGGFPFQMSAISELFDQTTLVVPCSAPVSSTGEVPLEGHNLSIARLSVPRGTGLTRKLGLGLWLLRNAPVIFRELLRADAVHAPIPGDIGTLGLLLALLFRKPLFVRHCGNWFTQRTTAEKFWKWSMERFAGGRYVALATGGALEPPSRLNHSIRWIFSTSLTAQELRNCAADRHRDFTTAIRLIVVCRQERAKGVDVIIQSLPLILDWFPDATLDVVGDGGALMSLKEEVAKLGLESRVCFHGKLNHSSVMSLLQQSDLFCYPTKSEGFPKAVLEALACGLPVVTTRVSVLPHLVGDTCGAMLDETTPAAVAEAVRYCVSNPLLYRSMSARARERAYEYSLERWRDTIGEILKSAWGPVKSHV